MKQRIVFDGPAAIAAANLQKPDVVLLDLSLPGMSGIEVAAELRRDPERSRCVLVAITGHGKDSVPSPSPFDGYFAKPLDFVSLLAYLSEISGQAGTVILDAGRRLRRACPASRAAARGKRASARHRSHGPGKDAWCWHRCRMGPM